MFDISIPLFILFRALGYETDKSILSLIIYDSDNIELRRKLLDLLIPSVKSSHPIFTQKGAYQMLSLNTKGKENFNVVDLGSTVPSGDDNLKDVATDGSKWLIVGEDGVLLESTDSGETWILRASEIFDSSHDIMNIAADVYLPLT